MTKWWPPLLAHEAIHACLPIHGRAGYGDARPSSSGCATFWACRSATVAVLGGWTAFWARWWRG